MDGGARKDFYHKEYEEHEETEGTENVFTSDEALSHAGFGVFNVIILVCCTLMLSNTVILLFSPVVLLPLIQCDMNLNQFQSTLAASMVFLGYFIGNIIFGTLSDRYGRKKSILLGIVASCVVSLQFSFAPNYYWVLIFQFLLGTFAAGIIISNSLCIEFMPLNKRSYFGLAFIGLLIAYTWYGLIVMYYLHSKKSWRVVLRIAHVFMFAVTASIFYVLVPESPRFLLTAGQTEQALAVYQTVWKRNRVKPMRGRLTTLGQIDGRGDILESFRKPYLKSTLLLGWLFFVNGLTRYGAIFLVPELKRSCLDYSQSAPVYSTCDALTKDDVKKLIITSLLEIPGIFVVIPLINYIGRKKTLPAIHALLAASLVPCVFLRIVLLQLTYFDHSAHFGHIN